MQGHPPLWRSEITAARPLSASSLLLSQHGAHRLLRQKITAHPPPSSGIESLVCQSKTGWTSFRRLPRLSQTVQKTETSPASVSQLRASLQPSTFSKGRQRTRSVAKRVSLGCGYVCQNKILRPLSAQQRPTATKRSTRAGLQSEQKVTSGPPPTTNASFAFDFTVDRRFARFRSARQVHKKSAAGPQSARVQSALGPSRPEIT